MNPFNKNLKNTVEDLEAKDKFSLGWSVLTVLVCMIISAGILFFMNFYGNKGAGLQIDETDPELIKSMKMLPDFPFFRKKENILILGVDSNGKKSDRFDGTRSDTIIVASIDFRNKSVNAISIPRDSKVYISSTGEADKINAAHAIGGPKETIATIQNTFGIQIHHYIVVDYEGIKEFVQAIGGVPVNVEKRMHYTDRSGGLYVDLYPGEQILDSESAVEYIRFRHDAIGDIGRMQRQQQFLRGVINKLQSKEIIVKIPEIIKVCSEYIKTDMNFYDLAKLASFSKKVDLGKIQTAVLPGGPSSRGRISYWILDAEKTQDVIDMLIYREKEEINPQDLTVSIIYSQSKREKAEEAKRALEEDGYKVSCMANVYQPHTELVSHTKKATYDNAKFLRNRIPDLKDAMFTLAPNNYFCGETDYTVVLSKN